MAVDSMVGFGGMPFVGAFLFGVLAVVIVVYVITAISLMKLAKRTKTENGWFAWIPLLNVLLMTNMAGLHWGFALGIIFAAMIPVVGALVSIGLIGYTWWLIMEKLKKHGALGLLMLVPLVNLIFLIYLAFFD